MRSSNIARYTSWSSWREPSRYSTCTSQFNTQNTLQWQYFQHQLNKTLSLLQLWRRNTALNKLCIHECTTSFCSLFPQPERWLWKFHKFIYIICQWKRACGMKVWHTSYYIKECIKSKTKICGLKLLVVLYDCEAWTLTLREQCRLRVLENRILRRIFRPKRDENGE
jgi:hypothetical protein